MTNPTHEITRNLPPPHPWEPPGPGNRPIRKGTPCVVVQEYELSPRLIVRYVDADGDEREDSVPSSAVRVRVQEGLF